MNLDLSKLRTFVEVVRCNSYTAAARRLNVTQSAVSHAIRKLESSTDTSLVEWRSRRIHLTSEGEVLFRVCDRVFRDLEDVEAGILSRRDGVVHSVVLGAPVEFGTTVLARKIVPFLRDHPELHVDFLFSHNLVQPLLDDEIDIAVDCKPHVHPSIDSIGLFREKYVVVASPGFLERSAIRSPLDLQDHPVVSLDKDATWWDNMLLALPPGERPAFRHVIQINHVRGIINATQEGLGVAFLPKYTVLGEIERRSLVVLFPELKLLEDRFAVYQKRSLATREKNRLMTGYLLGLQLDEYGDSIRIAPTQPDRTSARG